MDLLAFHAKTYGFDFDFATVGFTSLIFGNEGYQKLEEEEKEEDDLGCYPDGVKRTLTDDQIEIFRHSEIHALLERDNAAKIQAQEDDEAQTPTSKVSFSDEGQPQHQDTTPVEQNTDDELDDDAEYSRFLEQERKEFELAAAQRRQRTERDTDQQDQCKISTRRKVREMDAVATFDQALMYDDESADSTRPGMEDTADEPVAEPQGRKIWWPVIGKNV